MIREKKVLIKEDDKELPFVIRQMPATRGTLFGVRCAKALAKCGVGIPDVTNEFSAMLYAFASIDLVEFEGIMDEALSCVTYTGGVAPQVCDQDTLNAIVTDPESVFKLVSIAIEMNVNFIERHVPNSFREVLRGAIDRAGKTSHDLKKVEN